MKESKIFFPRRTQFLVFTHVMRRPYWCTESKTFFAIVLYTNMAAVTSRENQEYFRTKLRMLNKRLSSFSFQGINSHPLPRYNSLMLLQSRVYAHNSRIFQDIFLLLEEEMKCGRPDHDLAKQNNEMRLSSLISSF